MQRNVVTKARVIVLVVQRRFGSRFKFYYRIKTHFLSLLILFCVNQPMCKFKFYAGSYSVTQLTAEDSPPMPIAGHVDVFGLPVQTFTGRDGHVYVSVPKL